MNNESYSFGYSGCWLPNSMEESPLEDDSSIASPEIPSTLCNPKFHYCAHMPLARCIQSNPSYFLNIRFTIVPPPKPRSFR